MLHIDNKTIRRIHLGNGTDVKHIYRGTDVIFENKLIEGEDYVTADWLKGDGAAYIITNLSFADFTEYSVKMQQDNFIQKIVLGARGNNPAAELGYDQLILLSYQTGGGQVWRQGYSTTGMNFAQWTSNPTEVYWDGATIYADGVAVAITSYTSNADATVQLFWQESAPAYRVFNGQIAYFNISNKCNMTPCKLLTAIPASLDGNGIARAAGQCGMYDSISGKFYGNVANEGAFTVSND